MAFRLVSSGGNVNDPVLLNVRSSGTITRDAPVQLVLGTTGALVGPAGVDATRTMLFGVGLDYRGDSVGDDYYTRVIRFTPEQLWDCDCANAATTAQIGVRQALSASRGYIHNQATDSDGVTRVFLPTAMIGLTTGSGRLLGHFITYPGA